MSVPAPGQKWEVCTETRKELRILHLEDSSTDAELVKRQLREAGPRWIVRRAATREAFVSELEEFHPDVVLADYSLPDFDGLSAIRQVRQKDPDLPVIVVTGVLGDEAAVTLIRAGANDYLLKDRLAGLPLAVERAVQQAEQSRARKRAEAELQDLNAELEERIATRTAELEQLRAYDAEVGLRIQRSLLFSAPPTVSGLQIAALTAPSQRIDGDFYIFLPYPDHTLDFAVGDVMGKGIPAALLAAALKSQFHKALTHMTMVSERGTLPDPQDIVMLAHAQLVRELIELESFASLCYVRLDLDRQTVAMVDCGHTGMLHWHAAARRCEILHGNGLPLGIREGEIFEPMSVPFASGDLLLFFSDGITEARDKAGEFFGAERLMQHVQSNSALEPGLLVESIHQAVMAFTNTARLPDDLTSVCLRIGQPQARERDAVNVRSDLRELRAVREFVRQFCAARLTSEPTMEFVDSLELAVNEGASNIMRHAYLGRPNQWIRLEAEAGPDSVAVHLKHLGRSFVPPESPKVPDGTWDVGFGTYIMARSVDQVRYHRDDLGRNCVSLVKFLKSRKEVDSNGIADR